MNKPISEPKWSPRDPKSTSFEMVFGGLFDPFSPDSGKIDLDTIALVLSNSCRFNGHVLDFYSTAQHSVLVAYLSPRDIETQRMALLHDADEAFGIPDLLTQVKKEFPEVRRIQAGIGRAIEERFALDPDAHLRIKPADRQALLLEKDRLKRTDNPDHWKQWSAGLSTPEGIEIDPLPPREARELFEAAARRVFEEGNPICEEWISTQPGFKLLACVEMDPQP